MSEDVRFYFLKVYVFESKEPQNKCSGVLCQSLVLVDDGDVRGLQTLGALFNCELDLLAFLQVLETISLNSGEVNEDIGAAIAFDEPVAFCSIEPFDCTVDTIRHFCLLWQVKIWRVLIGRCIGAASTAVKQIGPRTYREPTWYFQSKLLVSYGRKDNMRAVRRQ